jgi:hypothetical protein
MCEGTTSTPAYVKIILPLLSHLLLCLLVPVTAVNSVELHGYKPEAKPQAIRNIYSFLAFSTWSLTCTKNFDFTAGGNTLIGNYQR